jgi:tetratricopeptide (TPR) repeat protein
VSDALAAFRHLLSRMPEDAGPGGCELVLSQLDEVTARSVRLGAIPHYLDLRILPVLCPELSDTEAERVYAKIATLSLVTCSGTELALHDSVRRYLFNNLLAGNRPLFAEISARLNIFFASQANGSEGQDRERLLQHRMFHLIGADERAGITEFERMCRGYRHRGQTDACSAVLKLVHEYDAGFDQRSCGIIDYHEGKLQSDRRNWELAQPLFEKILHNPEIDARLRMKAWNRLGLVHIETRKWEEAITCFEWAKRIAAENEYRELARIYDDLAVAYRGLGNRERAEYFIRESIALAKRNNDRLCLATALNTKGTLLASFREYKEAIAAYLQALENLDESSDQLRRAQIFNNIGGLYADLAEWKESQHYFEMSLSISSEHLDTLGQARTLANLIRVYRSAGRIDQAIAAGERAIAYFNVMHDDCGAGNAALSLAKLCRGMGRKDDALKKYDEALKCFKNAGPIAAREYRIAETDRGALLHAPGIPWWVWAAAAFFLLLIVLLVALLWYAATLRT